MSATEDGFFESRVMDAASDVTTASNMIQRLENIEAEQRGVTVREVRGIISRRVKLSAASIANLRRGRRKSVKTDEMGRVRVALIKALQKQIVALEHEINIHRQTGADHRDRDFAKAQAALDEARALIARALT